MVIETYNYQLIHVTAPATKLVSYGGDEVEDDDIEDEDDESDSQKVFKMAPIVLFQRNK